MGKQVYAGEETRLAVIPADTGQHGAFETLHGHPSGEAFARALRRPASAITAQLRASSCGGY